MARNFGKCCHPQTFRYIICLIFYRPCIPLKAIYVIVIDRSLCVIVVESFKTEVSFGTLSFLFLVYRIKFIYVFHIELIDLTNKKSTGCYFGGLAIISVG